MTWTDLGNPIPRDKLRKYEPYTWPSQNVEYLPIPIELNLPRLEEIIACRRTRRTFGQLNREQLASFLWLSCRINAKGEDHVGFQITQRPVPSAGAIHPIHLLLGNPNNNWVRYEPENHAFVQLGNIESPLSKLWAEIPDVIDPEDGTALLFVAEPGKTYAKYKFADSLIWRDAGVLIGHMALVAEALHLNFCPLGITGEPWAGKLDNQCQLAGVGMALLGSRTPL
ncbi:MAG: hypothetical protein PHD65_02890 [Gallionella sp.]|nr:hypothetical protein [Gallionella sp.]